MKKKQSSKKLTIYTEHSYNDHTDYPPPPVHTLNPTDANIDAFSSPHSEPNDSFFYSEKWQRERIVEDSEGILGIQLYGLGSIMAKEECYNEILSKLWDYSGLNDDGDQRFPKWEPTYAADRQSRSWVWYWLLCRWTIFEEFIVDENQSIESYYFSHLKKIPRLSLYKHINGQFKLVDQENVQSPEQYIKLNEFKGCLTKIAERLEWKLFIPLPSLLCSDDPPGNYKIEDLIRRVRPEIELIYTEIKKMPAITVGADKLWKKAVLKKWKENKSKMNLLKQTYLEEDKLYALYGSNIKRDFVGRVLQKIVEGQGLEFIGIQNLYKRYKSIRKK